MISKNMRATEKVVINETEGSKNPNYSRTHMKETGKKLLSEYTKAVRETLSQRNEHR